MTTVCQVSIHAGRKTLLYAYPAVHIEVVLPRENAHDVQRKYEDKSTKSDRGPVIAHCHGEDRNVVGDRAECHVGGSVRSWRGCPKARARAMRTCNCSDCTTTFPSSSSKSECKMVFYFTSNIVDPPAFIYVGKDKVESKPHAAIHTAQEHGRLTLVETRISLPTAGTKMSGSTSTT